MSALSEHARHARTTKSGQGQFEMAKQEGKLVRPERFGDLDDLIQELGSLHKIGGTRLVADQRNSKKRAQYLFEGGKFPPGA
jgi:hypothetical protein